MNARPAAPARRRGRTLPIAVTGALLATAIAVAGGGRIAATELPEGLADWEAARFLTPLAGTDGSTADLDANLVREPVCTTSGCVVTTLRPVLEAPMDAGDDGWSFAVFDLTGAGGMETAVASVANHPEPTWTPEAGLLQHGRTYAWTVTGDDEAEQEQGAFVVDLQRSREQPFDGFGPFSVGAATGELVTGVTLDMGDGASVVNLEYRTSDVAGRQAGTSPLRVVSDGWSLSGSALGGASFYRIDSYATGDTLVAVGLDGTQIRYDRNDDGQYAPPGHEGVDTTLLYPTLTADSDGSVTLSTLDGSVSTFTSNGSLQSYSRDAVQGAAAVSFDVEWSNDVLRSVTDTVTNRTATFRYMGDRECRSGPGFDVGTAETSLCSITTFDGDLIELWYVDGRLARVTGPDGAAHDYAYNASGQLVAAREPLAADTIANGLAADDSAATWRVDYDGAGKVAGITSPVPEPGQAPLQRTYGFEAGTTTVFQNDTVEARVTFDPIDYRLLSTTARGQSSPLSLQYDDDLRVIGMVDELGRRTTMQYDANGNPQQSWGPAPQEWFAGDGQPHAEYRDRVPSKTVVRGGGAGMLGLFYDGSDAAAAHSAQQLITSGEIETLPSAVDPAAGWRLVALGQASIDVQSDSVWRLVVDPGADVDASNLVLGGEACAVDDRCELVAPTDVDESEILVDVVATYVSPDATPGWFEIQYSFDDGDTWQGYDPGEMLGNDLITAVTTYDVFESGQTPTAVTEEATYSDPLLGLVETSVQNGAGALHTSYEPSDPSAGLFARPTAVTTESGLTTTYEYWAADATATHPITGETLPQLGVLSTSQIGSAAVRGQILDGAGRLVATTEHGVVTNARSYDDRGRVERIEIASTGHELAPARSTQYHYGAGGDPRVTGVTHQIGDDTYVELLTVDLLGRGRTSVDIWGTTTTTTYDDDGLLDQVTYTSAAGQSATSTFVVDPVSHHLQELVVNDISGNTHRATITGVDTVGRITSIDYSNGISLMIAYDPVSGGPLTNTWIDGDGATWIDQLDRASVSGRTLGHELSGPGGGAVFSYAFDPVTQFLMEAAVEGTGDGPASTTWSYTYDPARDGARSSRTSATDDTTVLLEYGYNELLAPVELTETIIGDGAGTRSVEIGLDDNAIVHFDGVDLVYDVERQLVGASDATTSVELLRTATQAVIAQAITEGGQTTEVRYSGPFVLDVDGVVTGQQIGLPGAVSVDVSLDGESEWLVFTQTGDPWWRADGTGTPTGAPTHYSPDGELIAGETRSADDRTAAAGWRVGHGGSSLPLENDLIVFGARVYIPALGAATTMDPTPNAGPTPYSFFDYDSVNNIDPTGNSSEGMFDSWTSPGSAYFITLGLTVLIFVGLITGQVWLVALASGAMAAYFGLLSYEAFTQDDYVTGSFYAVYAVLALIGAGTAAYRVGAQVAAAKARAAAMRTPVPTSPMASYGTASRGSISNPGTGVTTRSNSAQFSGHTSRKSTSAWSDQSFKSMDLERSFVARTQRTDTVGSGYHADASQPVTPRQRPQGLATNGNLGGSTPGTGQRYIDVMRDHRGIAVPENLTAYQMDLYMARQNIGTEFGNAAPLMRLG